MLDYAKALNPAQYEAATCQNQAALVIAGAGSGKTRTIVYRLAWLAEHGVPPESVLLLTFTRKAANEMLSRASHLLDATLMGVAGGTFHSFAYGVLRRYAPPSLGHRSFTLMDAADIGQALRDCRDKLKIGKKDPAFPKAPTIATIFGKARNKELSVSEVVRMDNYHLLPYADELENLAREFAIFKKEKALLDYDDLLFELEALLQEDGYAAASLRRQFRHILVDEYQDTNLVQARLVRGLAGPAGEAPLSASVMAVGDEAQSIYGFRGANVNNILDFPKVFPDTRIIRLEENYRSTQPILDVANDILSHAAKSFNKKLFTSKVDSDPVKVITPLSDTSEALLVTRRIEELLASQMPHEIAVLFRSGFHSYPLEAALRKAGIAFRKYGGLRFIEAAHVKDVLAFARLAINPLDLPAFARLAAMAKGVGPKTTLKLHQLLSSSDHEKIRKAFSKYPELWADMQLVDSLRNTTRNPGIFFEKILDHYRPRLEKLYPDDWPGRVQGLEEIPQLARGYDELDLFVADLALENPDAEEDSSNEKCITLSTIHSAKGLEWNSVLLLDVVEDRFPSRHAQARPEDYEEERRLFYVACTRARKNLEIYAPMTVYNRGEHGNSPVAQSPFLQELSTSSLERFQERLGGLLVPAKKAAPKAPASSQSGARMKAPESVDAPDKGPQKNGYCRHRIFGRGKIVRKLDDDKVQVNFPGFGLKVILGDYLVLEDEDER